jgi:hypothetical protein
MKTLAVFLAAIVIALDASAEDDSISGVFVAAFYQEGQRPIPGTMTFASGEKGAHCIVWFEGSRYEIPVITKHAPDFESNPIHMKFDGASVTETLNPRR